MMPPIGPSLKRSRLDIDDEDAANNEEDVESHVADEAYMFEDDETDPPEFHTVTSRRRLWAKTVPEAAMGYPAGALLNTSEYRIQKYKYKLEQKRLRA